MSKLIDNLVQPMGVHCKCVHWIDRQKGFQTNGCSCVYGIDHLTHGCMWSLDVRSLNLFVQGLVWFDVIQCTIVIGITIEVMIGHFKICIKAMVD